MDVRVADHQVETGDSLKERAVSRIEEMTEKYYSRAVGANVTFGRGAQNGFSCDIVAPVGKGIVLKASHNAATANAAFEGAADRIEKQLRRYSRRLKEHHAGHDVTPRIEANASYRVFADDTPQVDPSASPAIVAETRTDIPQANVADAVMLMDLRNTTALLFRNTNTSELNMVYRREDGNIGWVEPNGR